MLQAEVLNFSVEAFAQSDVHESKYVLIMQQKEENQKRYIDTLHARHRQETECMQTRHQEQTKSVQERHLEHTNTLQTQFSAQIETLCTQHVEQIDCLHAKHQKQIEHLSQQIAALQDKHLDQRGELERSHKQQLVMLQTHHKEEVETLQQQLRELESESTSNLRVLNSKNKEEMDIWQQQRREQESNHDQQLRELESKHKLALADVNTRHKDELEALQQQLRESQRKTRKVESEKEDLDRLRSKQTADMEHQRQMLEEERSRAVRELENKRQMEVQELESARLEQLRALQEERKVELQQLEEKRSKQVRELEEEKLKEKNAMEKQRQKQIESIEKEREKQMRALEKERQEQVQELEKDRHEKIRVLEQELREIEATRLEQFERQKRELDAKIKGLEEKVRELKTECEGQNSLVEVLLEEIKVLQQLQKETAEAVAESEVKLDEDFNIQRGLEEDLYAAQSLQVSLVLDAERSQAKQMHEIGSELSKLSSGIDQVEQNLLYLQSAVWRQELIRARDAAVLQAQVAADLRAIDKRTSQRFESAADSLTTWVLRNRLSHLKRCVLLNWQSCTRNEKKKYRHLKILERRRLVSKAGTVWRRLKRLVAVEHKVQSLNSQLVFRALNKVFKAWSLRVRYMEAIDHWCARGVHAQRLRGAWAAKSLHFAAWQRSVSVMPAQREFSHVVEDLSALSRHRDLACQKYRMAGVESTFARIESARELDTLILDIQAKILKSPTAQAPPITAVPGGGGGGDSKNLGRYALFTSGEVPNVGVGAISFSPEGEMGGGVEGLDGLANVIEGTGEVRFSKFSFPLKVL